MISAAALAATLKRDRAIVLVALLIIAGLAWAYTIWVSSQMSAMPEMTADMPGMDMSWSLTHFGFLFLMWTVMMIGMMTPSVAPMIILYAGVARYSGERGEPFAPAGWFVSGYLLAWTLFSLLATLAQWGLETLALISTKMVGSSRTFGGIVLIAAGVYQWLPLKNRCLTQCRAPLSFVQRHGGFQQKAGGSVRLGFVHGMYCIGCCWALMALLFVGGVMNLLWIAALMVLVLLEKLLPWGAYVARLAGIAAVLTGAFLLVD